MKYTTHFNLRKPDYTDTANISDLNANMDAIDIELYHTSMARNNITAEFSDMVIYEKDDLVIYDFALYKCKETLLSSGEWNPDDWEPANLDFVLNPLIKTVNMLKNFIAKDYDPELAYDLGDLTWFEGKLYKCIVSPVTDGERDANEWEEVIFSEIVEGASNNGSTGA